MKWKLSVFREPFKSHKVGEEATELRPDMGPQQRRNGGKIGRTAAASVAGRRSGKTWDGSVPAGGTSTRNGTSGGGIYGLGRGRRVVVKARYRMHQAVHRGGRQRVLAAHVRYLGRPNATGLARAEAFFSGQDDALAAAALPTDWAQDRYHWRIIVSPEGGGQLDLRQYVRDYAERLERELDTPLEWVAVTHHNTDQPHAHLLIRGRRDDSRDLVLPPEMVQDGLRAWAEQLATRHLGERSEAEANGYLNRLATARRVTELDELLLRIAVPASTPDGGGAPAIEFLDVQVSRGWSPELAGGHHLRQRLEALATMGFAERTSPRFRRPSWRIRADFIEQLDALLEREVDQGKSSETSAEAADRPTPTQPRPHDRQQRHDPKGPQVRQEKEPNRGRNPTPEASTNAHELD